MNLRDHIKTQRVAYDSANILNVLFASSDIAPFSNEGALASIAQQLPKALASKQHRVTIITPLYEGISPDDHKFSKRITPLKVTIDPKKKVSVNIWERNIDLTVRIVFIDYKSILSKRDIKEKDQAEMFAFFSRAVVAYVDSTSVPFDVVHCNDWQTSLIPEYLAEAKIKIPSVLSIYNMEIGKFGAANVKNTKLPKNYNKSFLGTGIKSVTKLTTTSNGMKDELLQRKSGVEKDLIARKKDFLGILNGVDYASWNPIKDSYLVHPFDLETLNGKRLNKVALQHQLGLPIRPTQPLVAFIGELSSDNGVDILVKAMRDLLKKKTEVRDDLQVIFLGDGEEKYKKIIKKLVSDFPNRAFASFAPLDSDAELFHRYLASADILAIPTEFEPGGSLQMFALRYGTLPLVHKVGGLADTVKDADGDEEGNGFTYDKQTANAIHNALERAITQYRVPRQWRPLMMNAMNSDFSWERAAGEYEALYFSLR